MNLHLLASAVALAGATLLGSLPARAQTGDATTSPPPAAPPGGTASVPAATPRGDAASAPAATPRGDAASAPASVPSGDAVRAPAAAPPAAAAASDAIDTMSLASMAWLAGCWKGAVNQREFREHWLPPAGNMMVGVSHSVTQGRTQSYDYLRLEPRVDGVHYVAIPPGKPPVDFRLAKATADENGTHFTFVNVVDEFPQRLVYHHGAEGWLYASVEGKVASGAERTVTFPMRHTDCETGELIQR